MIGERAGTPRGFANFQLSKFANLEIYRYQSSCKLLKNVEA